MTRPTVLPSAYRDSVGTRDKYPIAAQWLAYAYPCQRFTPHLAVRRA